MAKRFTDTTKWGKRWFSSLSPVHKLIWLYLLDECEHHGVWSGNFTRLAFDVGVEISGEEFEEVYASKIHRLPDGKYFIPAFIEFQQGVELSETKNAHKPIISFLRQHGFSTKSPYEIDGSVYSSGTHHDGSKYSNSIVKVSSSLKEDPDAKAKKPLAEDPIPEDHDLRSWVKLCSEAYDRSLEKLGLPPALGMWEASIVRLVNERGATKAYFGILGLGEQETNAKFRPAEQSQLTQLFKEANLQRLVPLGMRALERMTREKGGAA